MNKLTAYMSFCFIAMTILSFAIDGQTALAATKLTSTATDKATVLNVTSTAGFLDSDVVMLEGEIIYYTGVTETTFTGLTRGYNQTDKQNHKAGTKVYNEPTGLINQAVGFNILEMMATDGPIKVLVTLPWTLSKFFAKLVMWDFSFLAGDLMGFPLSYIKFLILYPISAGFVIQAVQVMGSLMGLRKIIS